MNDRITINKDEFDTLGLTLATAIRDFQVKCLAKNGPTPTTNFTILNALADLSGILIAGVQPSRLEDVREWFDCAVTDAIAHRLRDDD